MQCYRTHRARWVTIVCSLTPLLMGLSGCTILAGGAALGAAGGAIASRDIRVRPGASLRVEYTRAPDIPIVLAREADTTWLHRTEYLIGRVAHIRGDTLWMDVSESRTATSRVTYGRGQAQVVVDQARPGMSVVVLANRPAYIVAGAALGTALGGGAIIIYCKFKPCMS